MSNIRRALLSVYNKDGVLDFARGLQSLGIELLSTGGTYALLKKDGIAVREVSSYTGFPEIMGGRVKTLHPMIHGGILAKRDDPKHQEDATRLGIPPIDLIAVNLYPFKETIAKPDVALEEAIENIDIGGPTMLRAAAKNYKDVVVVVDPNDYSDILKKISDENSQGTFPLSEAERLGLAQKVFCHTADYDKAVSSYLSGKTTPFNSPLIKGEIAKRFPDNLVLSYQKVQTLRYGENPHQQATFYRDSGGEARGWANAKILWGKEMSYNNFLDADSALKLLKEFEPPAAVIVKHNNPCGIATGKTLLEAYQKAKAADPVSAFGGVAAFNRPIPDDLATEITSTFMEVVVAPSCDSDALLIFQKKKDLRILEAGKSGEGTASGAPTGLDIRLISGGLLVQDPNNKVLNDSNEMRVVTRRAPTPEEEDAMLFAWKVCKHIKSNAIVFAKPGYVVGIGAGQMSRVDSVEIAIRKAQVPITGSVMASDAFFPFRDGLDIAAKAGVSAVIQPGGSIRDKEVIAAADEHQMAMVFTGIRHFRH
ncbi:MAG: bifunctional phosphoribosylaminoimidazolecarboxamide formyltransferase/IMP cyclohydrolase [Nitrospirae bacterium]|nr:bifunctional phosphoribosylaminoimidazolecarboxamide formyltransferase/IMP cyclohydrolase [Candidatus Troglogloeales bacterium]